MPVRLRKLINKHRHKLPVLGKKKKSKENKQPVKCEKEEDAAVLASHSDENSGDEIYMHDVEEIEDTESKIYDNEDFGDTGSVDFSPESIDSIDLDGVTPTNEFTVSKFISPWTTCVGIITCSQESVVTANTEQESSDEESRGKNTEGKRLGDESGKNAAIHPLSQRVITAVLDSATTQGNWACSEGKEIFIECADDGSLFEDPSLYTDDESTLGSLNETVNSGFEMFMKRNNVVG